MDGGGERVDVGDDQYEGVEYDKEPQQKDSDLRLVEGEDEGEGIYCIINYVNICYFKSVICIYIVQYCFLLVSSDEDDQIDYPQNLKQDKRE